MSKQTYLRFHGGLLRRISARTHEHDDGYRAKQRQKSKVYVTTIQYVAIGLAAADQSAIRRLLDAARAAAHAVRNAMMRWGARSDYKRWTSARGLEGWWDQRTERIARFVPPESRVIEFGAGRRTLEKLLPQGCSYIPSDLVDRGPDTIICDLNLRPLPNLQHLHCQVAVFGGVLEYVRDVPALAQWLADAGVQTCVASFDPVPTGCGLIGRYRELMRRSHFGYMNNLTEPELLRSFEIAGFAATQRQTWNEQVILLFLGRS